MASSGAQLLCAESEETLPRRLRLDEAGLLLTTADPSGPADKDPLSEQSKSFRDSGLCESHLISSALADQNHKLT